MTDRSTLDTFERRISAGLERYVAGAVDPRPASEIADAAMRPRGAGRVGGGRRSRRLFYLAIAAVLLIPVAYIGATLLRPPEQDLVTVLPSPPPATPSPPPTQADASPAPTDDLAVFVRRTEGDDPGVSLFAVRPDGGEVLLRHVPDSVLPSGSTIGDWGTASSSGWVALGAEKFGGPWPMILVDLADPESEPWVIDEANLGGVSARWGPTGLVAAMIDFGSLVVADPESRTTQRVAMQGHGLVGGGPSIVWNAEGTGIVGDRSNGTYEVVPIDGGDPIPEVGAIFDPRGGWGPGLSTLQICTSGMGCSGGDDGRVEILETDGGTRAVWSQDGTDRALAAVFGRQPDEYWLAVDAHGGRQFDLVHVQGAQQESVDTVNRAASWQYVGAPTVAPDQSSLVSQITIGDELAGVVLGSDGSQTFHTGNFAGFIDDAASATLSAADFGSPDGAMPLIGVGYQLPTLEELIAAETELNPGRIVLGSDSRDAFDGETTVETYLVPADEYEGAEVYLDCLGPSPVTVTIGSSSTTSPCLTPGSYGVSGNVLPDEPIEVEASGDTSWRVVIYGTDPNWTPPPDPLLP